MSKLPWFKFFPTDWRADVGLKLCSLAARGLWLEMICIMHEAGGYLEINGSPVSTPALAALSGTTPQEITGLLGELEEAGVFSRDRKGRLYSRRMLRDLKKAGVAQKNGRKGGNPNLLKDPSPSRKRKTSSLDKAADKAAAKGWDKAGLKAQKPDARVQTQKITPEGVKKAAVLPPDFEANEFENIEDLVDPETGELTQLMRAARLKEDWEPTTDDIAFARKRGLKDELLATEALKFRNYWTSLAGRKASKLDWHRTWQNWILRGYGTSGQGAGKAGHNAGHNTSGGSFGGSGSGGRIANGQRPGGLDLAEVGARVLGRAQAQDDLS